jgi:DNA-binding NtrC family response regulator
MMENGSALLVHDYEYPLADLGAPLTRLGFRNLRARSCREARYFLGSARPPALVFTDTDLPDGGWTETVAFAGRARPPVPVIVVSRVVDIRLYLDAMEAGATEFMVPPFRESDVKYVVRGAAINTVRGNSDLARGRASAVRAALSARSCS